MNDDRSLLPPGIVAWLGYGGLVPFIGLALLALIDPQQAARWWSAQVAYAGVILSFIGALHWGFAMCAPGLAPPQRHAAYLWSVAPALLGWVAALSSPWMSCVILVAGFAMHLAKDQALAHAAGLPAWYLPLRRRLTLVAIASMLVSTARPLLLA